MNEDYCINCCQYGVFIPNQDAMRHHPDLKRWMKDEDKTSWIIDRCGYVTLSTIDEQGFPRPVAIDVTQHDGIREIWMTTYRNSAKAMHIFSNPKAGISFVREADSISLSADLADGARITTTAMNLNGRRFFCPSLPCEDLIFPVNFRSARGSFRSTYPFRLFDRVFESASFTVKDGKIASASGIEPAYINRYMNIDERAAFAGEIILCESLTQPAKTDLAFGIPLLDRMRSSEVVFGGISPEAVTLDDETQLEASGLNTSFARLEVPVGSRQLSVAAKLSDGRTVSIFEDGVFALGI